MESTQRLSYKPRSDADVARTMKAAAEASEVVQKERLRSTLPLGKGGVNLLMPKQWKSEQQEQYVPFKVCRCAWTYSCVDCAAQGTAGMGSMHMLHVRMGLYMPYKLFVRALSNICVRESAYEWVFTIFGVVARLEESVTCSLRA